jgi:hypothetical protein
LDTTVPTPALPAYNKEKAMAVLITTPKIITNPKIIRFYPMEK